MHTRSHMYACTVQMYKCALRRTRSQERRRLLRLQRLLLPMASSFFCRCIHPVSQRTQALLGVCLLCARVCVCVCVDGTHKAREIHVCVRVPPPLHAMTIVYTQHTDARWYERILQPTQMHRHTCFVRLHCRMDTNASFRFRSIEPRARTRKQMQYPPPPPPPHRSTTPLDQRVLFCRRILNGLLLLLRSIV